MKTRLTPLGLILFGVWMLKYGRPGGRYGQYSDPATVQLFGFLFIAAGVYLLFSTRARRRPPRPRGAPPHAVYSETRTEGVRTYELADARLHINVNNSFSPGTSQTIDLSTVSPAYTVLRMRAPMFYLGIVVAIGFAFVALLTGEVFVWSGCIAVGLLIAALTFRKQTAYRFRHETGKVAFDIYKAGPQKARAEEFVQAVSAAIAAARPTPNPHS